MGKALFVAVALFAVLVVSTIFNTDKNLIDKEITDQLVMSGKGLLDGGSSDGELQYDPVNKVRWPKDTPCWQPGCAGTCSRWQLISHPALNCWFCYQQWVWTEFLSHPAQALVYNGQQRMINLSGGIFSDKFNRSKLQQLAIQQFGDLRQQSGKGFGKPPGKEATDPGKGKDLGKGKSKGKDMDKGKNVTKGKFFGKGKDKGKEQTKGKNLGTAAAAVAAVAIQPQNTTVQSWLATATASAASGTEEGEEPHTRSRPTSTSSRKSATSQLQQTPRTKKDKENKQIDADNLALAAKLKELIENCQGDSISLDTLRQGIAPTVHIQKPQNQTLCGANHEKASAVAKALRSRESAAASLQEAQVEVDRLKDQYEKDKQELRDKYDRFKTELGDSFDKQVHEARLKRNALGKDLELAIAELNKAQNETMQFYTSVASSSQIPSQIAHIVNAMAVDESGAADTETDRKSDKTHSPTHSEGGDAGDVMGDNDGAFQEFAEPTEHTEPEQTEEGFQLVGSGNKKGKAKGSGNPVTASAKGQGIGAVKKEKFEKRRGKSENGADSDDSAVSGASAKARKAAKKAGVMAPPVDNGLVQQPQYVFLEVVEREYLCRCCSDVFLLQDEKYTQSLDLLLTKYGMDKQMFLEAVAAKDESYFAKVLIRSAEPYPQQQQTGPTEAAATDSTT